MKRKYSNRRLMFLSQEEQKRIQEKHLDIIWSCPQRAANRIVDDINKIRKCK